MEDTDPIAGWPHMQIEIFSDVICPWCYIGKRRVERALAEFDETVDVRWRAFQLDPRTTTSGRTLERYAAKFGGPAEADRLVAQVSEVARTEGLELDLRSARHGSTIDAHRVISLADRELGASGQNVAVERLFSAYFTEGLDISDRPTLVRLGADAGLDASRVGTMLESDEGLAEVRTDLNDARSIGISGVPFFVIDGAYGVSGAQPTEVLGEVLAEVRRRRDAAAPEILAGVGGSHADACEDESCAI